MCTNYITKRLSEIEEEHKKIVETIEAKNSELQQLILYRARLEGAFYELKETLDNISEDSNIAQDET